MNKQDQARAITLFFFYSLFDEELVQKATVQTLKLCQRFNRKLGNNSGEYSRDVLVKFSNNIWKKYSHSNPYGVGTPAINSRWKLPVGTSLGLWRQFLKDADSDEMVSVLWTKVLSFSDTEVARGMRISTGTVRHRTARGLKLLGSLGMPQA